MILVLLACASAPDRTARLGPDALVWAPADLDEQAPAHRRWLDRFAVVGTSESPDVGAAVRGYSDLPEEEALAALTASLRGRAAGRAAGELVRGHGAAGCRAVFDAWSDGTGRNSQDLEDALVNGRSDCSSSVDLASTARGRAALAHRSAP